MSLTAAQIFAELARLAPSVAFEAKRELDPYLSWDGDGPSPREAGYSPYDVTVTADTIAAGKVVNAFASLGSCWYLPDEPLGDVHGYLPQMLQEAADELAGMVESETKAQLYRVSAFLKAEMRARYDEQRAAS